MAVLENKTKKQQLITGLRVARSEWARGKGLLGTKTLGPEEALWIPRCNCIHTFFMNYPIDCVFLDKNHRVKAVRPGIVPFRLVGPVWGARSVIEFPAGRAEELKIEIGDELHVGA